MVLEKTRDPSPSSSAEESSRSDAINGAGDLALAGRRENAQMSTKTPKHHFACDTVADQDALSSFLRDHPLIVVIGLARKDKPEGINSSVISIFQHWIVKQTTFKNPEGPDQPS